MRVEPIDNRTTFGYSNVLKTLYKKGHFPTVKYGFYGDKITPKNVTLEHLKCVSQGGKTELKNVVLASANKNQERGTRPLADVINWEYIGRYLEQFKDLKVKGFDGNSYIQMILNTVKELLKGEKYV